jgi:phenylacetyl-CoA:acceptor oxidoreductase
MSTPSGASDKRVPTYCYQCVAGPDFLTVRVQDGVATEVEPLFDAKDIHPGCGRACVKAYGLVQKTYNPNRVLTPMKRTNPKKGQDEDPGFVPISWDEALDLVADKLNAAKAKGLTDESGYPRVAASFGGGGTPTSYMGAFPAFLSAWKVVDLSFGSGQGVKCTHSEHLYGELWHRAFTVCPDTPTCEYVLSFGGNVEASGGVVGVKRHADARARGIKRVQVEPHLSITGACSAEWVPIKPKTDPAFMFAMIHELIFEHGDKLDLKFLRDHTSSPYLVGPNGYYMRDTATRKPLLWDDRTGAAVPHDTPDTVPALLGSYTVAGVEVGPDDQIWTHNTAEARTAHQVLADHVAGYTPEWAAEICGVSAETIRRISKEFLDHARIGETIEVSGRTLPLRPVSIHLGKTVNNGWGGYESCWARTQLVCMTGSLEVPGGTLGTTVRLNRPATSRQASVLPGEDGFMVYPWNPTDKENWRAQPQIRNAHSTLVPLVADSAWSPALGPTHFAWMAQKHAPDKFPKSTPPDVWFCYRTNPAISFWDTDGINDVLANFPFIVCFAYTMDETNHFADVLLPDCTDLEGLQLIRVGGTKYIEQFWDTAGFALRQPVAGVQGEARDFTWISQEIAKRTGLLEEFITAVNKGAAGIRLFGEGYDFSLDTKKEHGVEEIWDACCKAASAELSGGEDIVGLDYFKEHGYKVGPYDRINWYLFPSLEDQGIRFELPYQERLTRIGRELGNRLHEMGITWWDKQLREYEPLPSWHDFPGIWETALATNFNVDIDDYPFWLLTSRSMQYSWGGNVGIQMIKEVAGNIAGHEGIIINAQMAAELGIEDGDRIEVTSPLNSTRGRAVLRQGIRPDTILMIAQFNHWKTPLAKDFDVPSMNKLMPMLLDLTDATGSGADLVKVNIRKIGDGA